MRPWQNSVSHPTEPDPRPRSSPWIAKGVDWPISSRLRCPPVIPPPEWLFGELVEARRSDRAMRPASLREIVNALAFATRPRFAWDFDVHKRTRRLSASAGALHAIEIIVVAHRGTARMMRYDPVTHSLERLRKRMPSYLCEFSRTCTSILPEASDTSLVLIGDTARIESLYEHSDSLLWRDAGALLQMLALVSTAYRLAFCPLGILGNEIVEALGLDPQLVRPLGCAAIGRQRVEQRLTR